MTRFEKFAAWCERDEYGLFWPNLLYWVCVTAADSVADLFHRCRRRPGASVGSHSATGL